MKYNKTWLNYETRQFLGVKCDCVNYEGALRYLENQEYLGIAHLPSQAFKAFPSKRGRKKPFQLLLQKAPVMRVRAVGKRVLFHYWNKDGNPKPCSLITRWVKRYAADQTDLLLFVNDLVTRQTLKILSSQWDETKSP